MKSVFAAVAISAFCCLSAHANEAAQETEMKAQLAGLSAAFNKGDGKAVSEFFAMDATLSNPQGIKANGRAKIAEIIQNDLAAVLKSGKSDFKFVGMRNLAPDLAFVDSVHEITISPPTAGMKVPPMKIQFSGVAKRVAGKWLWLEVRPYAIMPTMMAGGPPPGMPPGMTSGKMQPPPGGPASMPPGALPPGAMPPGMKSPPQPPPAAAGQVPKVNKGN